MAVRQWLPVTFALSDCFFLVARGSKALATLVIDGTLAVGEVSFGHNVLAVIASPVGRREGDGYVTVLCIIYVLAWQATSAGQSCANNCKQR